MPKYWIEMDDSNSGDGCFWALPTYTNDVWAKMGIRTMEGTPMFEAPDDETAIKAFEKSLFDAHPFEAQLNCVFSLFGEDSKTAIVKIGGVAE